MELLSSSTNGVPFVNRVLKYTRLLVNQLPTIRDYRDGDGPRAGRSRP
jgi:hypothetical protein